MLSSIEAEILRQPEALKGYQGAQLERAAEGSIFVGAGDSYVASSIANHLSSMRYLVLDPYELASNPPLAKGRHVYFVSVSGRTASNLLASRAVRHSAKRRTAITANSKGPLAVEADSGIVIPYEPLPRMPGTLSFTLTLTAILKVAMGRLQVEFEQASRRARAASKGFLFADRGVTHFLGNGASFPVSQYAALKTFEILGGSAQATILEEFSHSTLFGLGRMDAVNILVPFDPQGLGPRLSSALTGAGYGSSPIRVPLGTDMDQVFSSIFAVQFAVLHEAKSRGLRRAYFATEKKKLEVSDEMIY